MSDDRLVSDRDDFKAGVRHDNLALRWESMTGEGRILAKGTEAVALYQSDMVEGFRSLSGGYMALGRVQADGSFRPMIRQAIPLQTATSDLVIVLDDTKRTGRGVEAPDDDAFSFPVDTAEEDQLLNMAIEDSLSEQYGLELGLPG